MRKRQTSILFILGFRHFTWYAMQPIKIGNLWIYLLCKFAHLGLDQGFSTGALGSLGVHGEVLQGPRAGTFSPKQRQGFYWWTGGHKCWESLEGATNHEVWEPSG